MDGTSPSEVESVFEETEDGVEFMLRPVEVVLTTSQTALLAELCHAASVNPEAPPEVAAVLDGLAFFFGQVTLDPIRHTPKSKAPTLKTRKRR